MNQWGTKKEIKKRNNKVIRLYKKGIKIKDISKKTGYWKSHIYNIVNKNKLEKRMNKFNKNNCKKFNKNCRRYDYDKIVDLYVNGNIAKKYLTYQEICEIIGCSPQSVGNAVKKAGVKMRGMHNKKPKKRWRKK